MIHINQDLSSAHTAQADLGFVVSVCTEATINVTQVICICMLKFGGFPWAKMRTLNVQILCDT